MTLQIYLNILLQTGIEDPNQFNDYLILGYIVMWLAFLVYVVALANKQRNVKQDIKLLQQLLREDEESPNW
jgi:CcmD family protein